MRTIGTIGTMGMMLTGLALSGCAASAPPGLQADVAWGFSCSGTQTSQCAVLATPGLGWDYIQFDGQVAYDETKNTSLGIVDAQCDAYQVGVGQLRLKLRAAAGGASIAIDDLAIDDETLQMIDGGCYVTARDGTNTYGGAEVGGCGTGAPTSTQPCQITNLSIDRDTSDGAVVELRLRCDALPNQVLLSSRVGIRDVVQNTQPALIRFLGCDGF